MIKLICSFISFCVYFSQSNHEFSLTLRKDRKYDTIKLSSEFRNDILTSLFKFHREFAEKIKTEVSRCAAQCLQNHFIHVNCFVFCLQKYSAYKYHWSGIGLPTQLEVTPCSLDQLDATSNKVIASYDYKDIVATIGMLAFPSIYLTHVLLSFNQKSFELNRHPGLRTGYCYCLRQFYAFAFVSSCKPS